MSPRRRRRGARRIKGLGLLALVGVLILTGLVIHGVYSGARHSDAYLTDTNATFAAQLNTIFDAQLHQGVELESLLNDMANLDRGVLAVRLRDLVAATEQSARAAQLAETPTPSDDAGERAAAIVAGRAHGTQRIAQAIQGLLGLTTPPIPGAVDTARTMPVVAMISSSSALNELTQGGEQIMQADAKVGRLRADLRTSPGHAAVDRSVFIADPHLLRSDAMAALVVALSQSSSLQATHEVSLRTVGTSPGVLPTQTTFDLARIPPTTSLEVRVTVANLGNVDEAKVAVVASILSTSGTVLSQVRDAQAILAGQSSGYVLHGLTVTPGSDVVLLVAVASPAGQIAGATLAQRYGLSIAPTTPSTTAKP